MKETILNGYKVYWNYMVDSFKHPSLYNPFLYVVIFYILCFTFELTFPKLLPYSAVRRKGFWIDLAYLIFMDYIVEIIGVYAVCCGVEYLTLRILNKMDIHAPLFDLHHALPLGLRFVIFFVLIDFLLWCSHVLLHHNKTLWEFHKIHHAQEEMGFASARHSHFGESIIVRPAIWIPFAIFGFKPENYVIWYLWINYFLNIFSHCNVKVNWGIFKYLFVTPEVHYWHHSKNITVKHGVNFGQGLMLWDLIFGHFYCPKDQVQQLGIQKNDVPEGFLNQMIYPFKKMFKIK